MRRRGVIGLYELGPPNKAGLRDVILVGPKALLPRQELPRYVQTRRLASGEPRSIGASPRGRELRTARFAMSPRGFIGTK